MFLSLRNAPCFDEIYDTFINSTSMLGKIIRSKSEDLTQDQGI